MTTDLPSSSPQPASTEAPVPAPRWLPGVFTWLWLILAITIIPWLHSRKDALEVKGFDTSAVNLVTYVLVLSFSLSLWLWFSLRSSYARPARRVVFWTGVTLGVLAMLLVRVDGFSGNMVPTGFHLAWQRSRDFTRAKPATVQVITEETPLAELKQIAKTLGTSPEETPDVASATPSPQTSTGGASTSPTEFDFPQFLGPRRDGQAFPVDLKTDWQTNVPDMKWEVEVGAGWSGFAVVGERAVTQEQYGDEEWVTCRDTDNGSLLWSYVIPGRHENVLGGVGPRATPTIHNNRVFTVSGTGVVSCLDFRDGTKIWSDDLRARYGVQNVNSLLGVQIVDDEREVQWGRSGSPLIYNDLCIVPAGGSKASGKVVSLIAFHVATGEVAWQGGSTQISYASPTLMKLAGQEQVVSVNETNVTGHDPATGNVLWTFPWEGNSGGAANCSQPRDLGEDLVFISKGYGQGAALFKVTATAGKFAAETQWASNKVMKTKFTNVVVQGDFMYGLSDGVLECIRWSTGDSQWKRGRYGHGQILGVGDLLLVVTESSGEVVLLKANPKKHEELSRLKVFSSGGQTWNNLCLVGKKLLVRNADIAACYELP